MKTHVLYGKGDIAFETPGGLIADEYRKKKMPKSVNPLGSVRQALLCPVKSRPLRDIASGKRTACVIVNDITRPVPNSLILPPILKELTSGGIHYEAITILIATGTHRPNEGDEMVELVGEEIVNTYRVVNHFCESRSSLRHIGDTKSGTPVWLNSIYLDADVKVVTGLIEPHFMAGYSGGRKAICPGVAGIDTVRRIHSPQFMEHPLAENCRLDGNPLHRELLEIARMAGVDFILNVVIDEDRDVCAVFAGDVDAAHTSGVDFCCRHDRVAAEHEADIVVTSSAGYPLDKTYYQTIKGMIGAMSLVRDGGVILIASECSEGMGNASFVKTLKVLHRFENYDAYVDHISKDENFIPDQWQAEKLAQAARRATILFHSSKLASDWDHLLRAERVASMEEGLRRAVEIAGGSPRIAVIPEGPYVIPYVEKES